MKFIKLSLAAALAVTMAYAEEKKSDLEISANVAMTSNYVWRGMTQSDDSPAIQGGFDLDYKGLYAGAWGSNVNFKDNPDTSMEFDAYGGYKNEIAGVGYDIGYIQYVYPNDSKALNFGEAYVGLSYDFKVVEVSAKYSLGVQTDDLDPENAYEAAVSVPLPMDISIDGTIGNYENIGVYYLIGATKTLGKFDFTVAYSAMDFEADSTDTEDNIIATISTSF
ncbi:MAG: TorF family putative porin [Sulfurimonas sp.]|jgi:uncharacterized protein (TIGR02001 family)|nr:TorF family putative porin [Sulfurimonas sp.]